MKIMDKNKTEIEYNFKLYFGFNKNLDLVIMIHNKDFYTKVIEKKLNLENDKKFTSLLINFMKESIKYYNSNQDLIENKKLIKLKYFLQILIDKKKYSIHLDHECKKIDVLIQKN